MKIETNLEKYLNDYNEVVRIFDESFENNENKYSVTLTENEEDFVIDVCIKDKTFSFKNKFEEDKVYSIKKYSKINLYEALSNYYNKTFEWGSLTGVRPTKVAYKLLESGTDPVFLKEKLMAEYKISENKAKLIVEIIKNQKSIIKNDNLVDVYVNIPICPSRCKYCSFISAEISAVKDIVESYISSLKKEISAVKELIREKSLIVRSVYVGGGTPSVLNAEQLESLLSELNFNVSEFTVECGRPDTISREKLEVLKKHNVTRICVNPQTFVEKTLKAIGRKHTVKDVLSAYSLAMEFGFDVNIDLIAGLEGETFSNFKKSLNYAIEMAPQNITVHTLAVKRGSNLFDEQEKQNNFHELEVASRKLGHSPQMFMQTYAKHINDLDEEKLLNKVNNGSYSGSTFLRKEKE